MKKLILFLGFICLTNLTSFGQCNNPPTLSKINCSAFKCVDFVTVSYRDYNSGNSNDRPDSYHLAIHDINDSGLTNPLFIDTDDYYYYEENAFTSAIDTFLFVFYGENACGTSNTIIDTVISFQTYNQFIDTTCSNYGPPSITGNNQICSNESSITFTLNAPDYLQYISGENRPLEWSVQQNSNSWGSIYTTSNNVLTLDGNQIPNEDFQVYVKDYYIPCSCDGYSEKASFTIASLDVSVSKADSCGARITINAFGSNNNDCQTETHKIKRALFILNDTTYITTNNQGSYIKNYDYGQYTIQAVNKYNLEFCDTNARTITLDSVNFDITQNFHLTAEEEAVYLSIHTHRARVGINNTTSVYLYNYGLPLQNGVLTIDIPNYIDIDNISPTPSLITSEEIIWDSLNIEMFESNSFNVKYVINNTAPIGDEMKWKARFVANETHEDSVSRPIVNSCDPNEVIVNKAAVLDTEANKKLKYTVHFQNTGNDTAYLVRVIDTLDAKLDMATLEVLGASHDFEFDIVSGDVLQWTFPAINLLDSTSNEEKSKGWFQFFVDFKEGVVVNDFAESTAHIYFDTNEPITTNTAITTITNNVSIQEYGAVTFSLHPNPATSELFVTSNAKISSYQILSIDGRMVKQGSGINNNTPINVQTLPRGIYYLKIAGTNGQISVQPFEKM
jgi:uncharacterized repeat protein (TIGR01451 family)